MSKKSIKIVSTVTTIAMILMLSTSAVFAVDQIGGVNISPDTTSGSITNVAATGQKIIGIIRTIGIIVAVIILMVLGIKYMMGSAEEKASYKKTMMPYMVGAVLIFGASTLASVVYDFAAGI